MLASPCAHHVAFAESAGLIGPPQAVLHHQERGDTSTQLVECDEENKSVTSFLSSLRVVPHSGQLPSTLSHPSLSITLTTTF